MSLNKNKHAFTLAEVMIVLLVLTLLLAVFAPLITKRRTSKKGEELWRWATRNYLAGPMDAYLPSGAQPGTDPASESVFIGLSPESTEEMDEIYKPLGKIIIRAGYVGNGDLQFHMQLRHGRTNFEDIGHYAGSLLSDNANILFGGSYEKMVPKVSNATYPVNNIGFGFNSLNSIGDRGIIAGSPTDPPQNNIAIGLNASENLVSGDNNITIGSGAGLSNTTASNNTMVGYEAGFKTVTTNNTLIGYKSNAGNNAASEHNVFIGAKTGQQTNFAPGSNKFAYNTAIGYEALSRISTGKYNVAIGSGALKNLERGNYNVAIGYHACANLLDQSHKTCIGYNSGPSATSYVANQLAMGTDDDAERTYIGQNNDSSYGGDAVLELHNIGGTNTGMINKPGIKSNTTTVINGNLVVFGKTYLTVGNILYPFSYENNIFGAEYNNPCSNGQGGYNFNTSGNCSELVNLTLSDRRLKNINSGFTGGLDEINRIKVYNYIFKNDKQKKKHTGVIAQELQKIFPGAVYEDENGYLKIRWDEMFYASINAIKELNRKITSLIKETTNLEKQIQKLEQENEDLKAKTDALSKRVEALKNK